MDTITKLLKKPAIIDGGHLYRRYFLGMGEARSVRHLVEELARQGVVHPDTRRELTPMAIWFSLWTWAMKNQDEAYEIFNQAMRDEGKFAERSQFDHDLQLKAWTILKKNRNRFNLWLKRSRSENLIGV